MGFKKVADMTLIDGLKWRYSVKKFNENKKIPDHELRLLMESIRLAPSSFGLQPYKVIVISNKELKERLYHVSWMQEQILTASHLFVFCNFTRNHKDHVDEFIKLKARIENKSCGKLQVFGTFIKGKLGELSQEGLNNWTIRQSYIAMTNLLNSCAELKIDTCPMEGFVPKKYNEILDLDSKGLNTAVVVAAGYRSDDDTVQNFPKVRKPIEELFEMY